MHFCLHFLILFILLTGVCVLPEVCGQVVEKPNFIFIIVDDLNDYIEGLNGQPQILTPNIKTLEEKGTLFTNGFCTAPVCGPSRTSFLSGKDISYTQVYDNADYLINFRDNFTPEKNNAEVITLPEYLKNTGGYYTFGINKIFASQVVKDFDTTTSDPCARGLSWSRYSIFGDTPSTTDYFNSTNEGVNQFSWGVLNDSVDGIILDKRAADTAIQFIEDISSGAITPCAGAFFMAIGFSLPHLDLYVPEKYFPEYYQDDIYATPFIKSYNEPMDAFPYNGLVMPPQPDPVNADYAALGPLGQAIAVGQYNVENSFNTYFDLLPSIPEIDPGLSEEERKAILIESKKADAIMAYMAGVQLIDKQVGRLMEALDANPDIRDNTVIVFIGDNGFSFGEKYHWLKRSFWEPDIRVPFIIVDPAQTGNRICERPVSLLDLYPTILDRAGLSHPSFADGSYYPDGKSLTSLITSPSTEWERPVLITFEAENNIECSCFPQHAVRWDRFKYIKYASDGGNPINECISGSSYLEEELYENGIHNETDPHEWNNLIGDIDYQPVVHYLQQWLPENPLYLQKTFKSHIQNMGGGCLLGNNDTVQLSVQMYDTSGAAIIPPVLSLYRWTNNITNDTLFGTSVEFLVSSIPADIYDTIEKFIIYFQMVNQYTNVTTSFDLKYFYLHPENAPSLSFNTTLTGMQTVAITDIEISNPYTDVWWEMGDGHILEETYPEPYTYTAPGVYTITGHIEYGNDSTCEETATTEFNTATEGQVIINTINVFPNPASSYLTIKIPYDYDFGSIVIYSATGVKILETKFCSGNQIFINIESIPAGAYFVEVKNEMNTFTTQCVIIH